jgi:hypothetical protein
MPQDSFFMKPLASALEAAFGGRDARDAGR